jgi:hypothetical protein
MVQNQAFHDYDAEPTLGCVTKNLSQDQCGDSDDEIGDNHEHDCKSSISHSEQSDRIVALVVSG